MLSCQAATALMEKKLREKLSLGERAKLAVHNALCAACRHYGQQSRLIEGFFKSKEKAPVTPELEKDSKELEEKILRRLDGQIK